MGINYMQSGWMVEEAGYAFSKTHTILGLEESEGTVSLDNIGSDGKNLTIAVLSMNRSAITIRLLKSIIRWIPDFKGEILIGDNGSDSSELLKLYEGFKISPFKYRIIEFGKNYGVAGGRNRLFSEVKTQWIMSLDNDLYFTSNPLSQIQKDIQKLGVHFLALPFIDKGDNNSGMYGCHLFAEAKNGRPSIGIGSAYQINRDYCDKPMDGFLCTGVPGTAVVMNKATFFQTGAFDDNMFVGFEDTEQSLRLFQKGYKVGSCGMISLEHDHPKADNNADQYYEKARFSRIKLFEAAMYFEKKHGFSVWTEDTAAWVDMRQRKILDKKAGDELASKRYKIALVIDRTGWALDHVAAQIIKNLSDEFDFIRIYGTDIDNFADVLILAEKCEIIHVLWRGHLAGFDSDYCQQRIRNLGLTPESFRKKYIEGKIISTEVYDHLLLEGPESEFTPKLFINRDAICTNYAVSSKKLWDIYQKRPGLRLRPQAICQDGVDLTLFKPMSIERLKATKNRTIVFGWVGNSKWLVEDLKGINTIIGPAIEQLQDEGFDIQLLTSDRQNETIPHDEMLHFYEKLDCYLCASSSEGTPNPVLEAMACGVPVISTDVGIVPEVFGPKQKDYILEERSIDCLKQKIRKLIRTNAFWELSQENLNSIRPWNWPNMTENFRNYFRSCLK